MKLKKCIDSIYWSSTIAPEADDSEKAWTINFYGGDARTHDKSVTYKIRAIRGGEKRTSDRWVINGDGTVTDTETGLMWQENQSTARMNWKSGIGYCENSSVAGYRDWRFPTIKEFGSIYTAGFPGLYGDYWVSTTLYGNPGFVWRLNTPGYEYGEGKSHVSPILPVRGGQNQLSGHLVISSPTQSSIWNVGDVMPIIWDTAELSDNVEISISREGGKDGTFDTIVESTENDGTYEWTATGPDSVNCMLKVEPVNDSSKGTQQGLFIIGTVPVTTTTTTTSTTTSTTTTVATTTSSTTTTIPAPSIISNSPSGNAVATDGTVISVNFSQDMDKASINKDTFKVNNSLGDVIGTVNYDNEEEKWTATFTPAKGYFNYGTEYTVTITSGVRDTDGNALLSDYTWSFTTELEPDHPGYAIIIQGKTSSEEGLADHNRTTQFVYRILRERGLKADNIRYFNYNTGQEGVYSIPKKDKISATITGWAKEQMNKGPADLYIIMVNHGSEGRFFIHDSDPITPSDMAGWLDALQDGLGEDVRNQNKIIAILGFCHSGSFIPELSGANRVIITSSAANEYSYRGSADENDILEGEYFVAEFFRSVASGKSVKECFEEAVKSTETYTAHLSVVNEQPYYDQAWQHPYLDDNGDGKGNNNLSFWSGDGLLSENIKSVGIGQAYNPPGDVAFTRVADTIFLGDSENYAKGLWAKVEQPNRIRDIWIEVKPPNPKIKDTDGAEIPGQRVMHLEKIRDSVYNESMDRYEWNGADGEGVPGFEEPGIYQVFYFVKDNQTENVSRVMETRVYKNKKDNTPPERVSSLSARDEEKGLVTLDWEDSTEPDGDHLTYTVLIAEDASYLDSAPIIRLDSDQIIRKEGLLLSTCQIDSDDKITAGTNYYWKVLAIDKYGMSEDTEIIGEFRFLKPNPGDGWIQVYVRDSCTKQFLDGAEVRVGDSTLTEKKEYEYYEGKKTDGKYNIMVKAEGYHTSDDIEIEVSEGRIVAVNVDEIQIETNKDSTIVAVKNLSLEPNRMGNPIFSPPAGIYTEKQNVKIEIPCHPDGVTVYYTTDGSEPDETATPYETGSLIPTSSGCMTIKAKAYKTGREPSETASASYECEGSSKGNINGDGRADLADVILALRMVCGADPEETMNLAMANEVNGDGKIGLAEAIYMLKRLSVFQGGCQR